MDVEDAREAPAKQREQRRFARDGPEQQVLHRGGHDGVEDRVTPAGDGVDHEHLPVARRPVVLGEFAERTFRRTLVGKQAALDHDLGLGRHHHRVGHAPHHRERRPLERPRDLELVRIEGQDGLGGEQGGRIHADDHRDRKRLAARLGRVVEAVEVAREHEDAEPIGAAHLEAVDRHVLIPGLGIGRDDETGRDVGAGVVLVVDGDGKVALEVHLPDDFLLHGRRPRGVHLPAGKGRFDGPLIAVEEARFVRAERLRDPGTGGHEPGHDGDRVAAVRLGEPGRPATVEALRDRGEGEAQRNPGPGAGEPPRRLEPFEPAAQGRRRIVPHRGLTHR